MSEGQGNILEYAADLAEGHWIKTQAWRNANLMQLRGTFIKTFMELGHAKAFGKTYTKEDICDEIPNLITCSAIELIWEDLSDFVDAYFAGDEQARNFDGSIAHALTAISERAYTEEDVYQQMLLDESEDYRDD